ncbi:MAG: hypothetical protein V1911_04090 [Candidatus Micrarchaeota archaeon]
MFNDAVSRAKVQRSKAQMMMLDLLAAVLLLTVGLAIASSQMEAVYSTAEDLAYADMLQLAQDWSQYAVKDALLVDATANQMNFISSFKIPAFASEMQAGVGNYDYEILLGGVRKAGNCDGAKDVASVERIVIADATATDAVKLTIKVCS